MCPKIADTELGSVKALMTLSLDAIVAKVFRLAPKRIKPELRVIADLHMTPAQKLALACLVAEYFDGQQLELTATTTLGDIYARVVEQQFADLPPEAR